MRASQRCPDTPLGPHLWQPQRGDEGCGTPPSADSLRLSGASACQRVGSWGHPRELSKTKVRERAKHSRKDVKIVHIFLFLSSPTPAFFVCLFFPFPFSFLISNLPPLTILPLPLPSFSSELQGGIFTPFSVPRGSSRPTLPLRGFRSGLRRAGASLPLSHLRRAREEKPTWGQTPATPTSLTSP